MDSFAPPSGPPPPRVPDGWKAVWNSEYKEYFYVNIYTKQSTWEKPTEPAHRGDGDAPPPVPPPSYAAGSHAPANAGTDVKHSLESNNPYSNNVRESDEEMARRMQHEEEARVRDRGAADSYYSGGAGGAVYGQGQQQAPGIQGGYPGGPTAASLDQSRGQKSSGGFLGKLKDKFAAPQGQRPMGAGYGGQQYPPQGYGGGYPPQQGGYGGYPQQGYGGYPPQGYGGGYAQQPMYAQQPQRKSGLGTGGAAALGIGGGLLGGMLLADGMEHMEQNSYDQGYDQGYDNGDNGGGDYGGGDDMGGGDF